MEGYWNAILTGIFGVIIAVIETRNSRERKKAEARAERRALESRLAMDLMFTTSEMCDVLCIALQGGHLNGNVERARKQAEEARNKYQSFLRDQAAGQVTKI